MRYGLFGMILFLMFTCKKEAAKHCPVINAADTRHLVDLGPVSGIPQIMDTLARYPQLQVYRVYFSWGHDPGSWVANVNCFVNYKGLRLFNTTYNLFASSWPSEMPAPVPPPDTIAVSLEPAIDIRRANEIARETLHFEHCAVSVLGITNLGTLPAPNYRLAWHIESAEGAYPLVELDAQTGEIYYKFDGKKSYD